MDPKALRDLQLDVRLQRRHNWVGPEQLAEALEALPDAADKIATDDPPQEVQSPSPEPVAETETPAPGWPSEG